ncbi:MAG TPA: cbb3-type cytochrome c oxidase subunit II, partial [Giesbergeria sp.]|nr:cbb3-type cytochrome c oxidase subunit II [Giesbergeria sp.]
MENEVKLAAGAMVSLAVATAALVVLPYMEVRDITPPEGLKPYTSAQQRGRDVYIASGCVYCHTQQPRDRNLGPDHERGWGRASVPGDYVYDKPHLLGSMRTGP